jgi:hypothetical protein
VSDLEELKALRRLAELEAKAGGKKPDPTEGMSDFDLLRAGTGKAFYDLARGAGQWVGAVSREEVRESRERDAPLLKAGEHEKVIRKQKVLTDTDPSKAARMTYQGTETRMVPGPGGAGVALGNIGLALPLAFAPGANTVLGSGLYGAGYGALQPSESTGETAGNIALSGIGSAAITGAVKAGPALYKAMVSPFTRGGQERIALDTISRFAKDKDALSKATVNELVPGSKPTLAEITGDPGIAQLQRAAQAASPETASLMAQSRTARVQARKDALLSMGDATDKEFFEIARETAAQRLYGDAFKTPIDPAKAKQLAPDVKELLARPSIQKARDEALRLAKESGTILKASDMKGGSLEGLHYMKMAVDDMISVAKRAGNDNEVRVLMGTKDKLIGVMQQISPKYATAMAEYQAASKPINQIQVTNYLYDKLVPALSDLGAERLSPQAFAKALKDGDEMAKKATGFSGAKLADILTTEQMNLLTNLGLDLGREAAAVARAAVPGSPTAQYLSGRNAIREILGPLGLPQGWGEKVIADTIGGRALSAIAKPAENAVQSRLGNFLVNPAEAQAAAQRLTASNKRLVPLSELSRYALPPLSIGGSVYARQKE